MAMTYVFSSLVGLYTAAAAVIDVREHRIPNYLTVTAALLGLLFNATMPNGIGALLSLGGLAIGFCLLLLPWVLGGGGMGDVKLLAALGAWLGPKYLLITFAISVILAAGMALVMMIHHAINQGVTATKHKYLNQSPSQLAGKSAKGKRSAKPRRVVPFAVPVCLSTWLVLVWTIVRALNQT